ncbi:elongation factor G [Leisingera sp. M527]|uniref:elongation factor G n=1 Tax=unclassified Leisingera TaxID=2614906 RepID=UPI0021A4AF5B|nr:MULTISPECIES: elongation factor G [unclassified Leisingera]UWQ28487.1 elongation factor G [Leisingera sp. M523]UWQ33082.1 elongation factor G [Leisingera sp. M527]UWQ75024.1 elongation factor G [Leisingera sp. M658]
MRVFTILGPSQSGKSTLATALANLDSAAGKRQEVAGVAALQPFSFMGEHWAAIDIAGGADNLAQAGPALAASDAAVLCVPADAGAAVLSAPYLRKLEEAGIPAFLFVNRMDQAADRVAEIVAALQAYCSHNIILRQVPIREDGEVVGAVDLISERAWQYQEGKPSALIELPVAMYAREQEARTELLEALADFDDTLLEELIEDQKVMAEEVYDVATKVLQHNDLVPALMGSAEHKNGILRLMKSLRHEAPDVGVALERLSQDGAVVAVGCMADLVKHLGKTVMVRALDKGMGNGASVGGAALGSLTGIGGAVNNAFQAGDIGQAVKSDHLNLGFAYGPDGAAPLPDWAQPRPSTFRRVITPLNERDDARLSGALERLAEIDPALVVGQDEASGHLLLNLQGPLHMRRIKQALKDEFGVEVEERQVPPALRETISKSVQIQYRHRKQSGGAGQFADVLIEVKPLPRGSGFVFEETVKGGAVPKNYIPSVEAGAREALAQGLNGHPVVDICVTLKDGKHHSVDSSDYAFRTAGKNAVREALSEAGAVLLQPIMRVHIHVPSVFTGGLVPVVSGMKGQILGFEAEDGVAGWDVFETLLPMSAQDNLCNTLASATRGTGWFSTDFDHYEEARRADFAEA